MKAPSIKLDNLRVATPCPISWGQMTGNDRVRFCDHCQLNVYNISELTRLEAETLIASTEGRLCARIYRRADGTVLTKDCPVGLRALRKRISKRVAAVFAAMVSLSAAAAGQQQSKKTDCSPQVKITRTETTDAAKKVLLITVVDPAGAVIPGARLVLTNARGDEVEKTTANDQGELKVGSIEPGTYSISLEAVGFKKLILVHFIVEKDKTTEVTTILEPMATETIGVVATVKELIDSKAGTTILDERALRKLPIH
jgi:uncharacterized surface anchored protein